MNLVKLRFLVVVYQTNPYIELNAQRKEAIVPHRTRQASVGLLEARSVVYICFLVCGIGTRKTKSNLFKRREEEEKKRWILDIQSIRIVSCRLSV